MSSNARFILELFFSHWLRQTLWVKVSSTQPKLILHKTDEGEKWLLTCLLQVEEMRNACWYKTLQTRQKQP